MNDRLGPYMGLDRIIKLLSTLPREQTVALGWGNGSAHSYRGYYEDLAFKPKRDTTVGEMLDEARRALGETFEGWKGGEFVMEDYTTCWIAEPGSSGGDAIGPVLLGYMLGLLDEWPHA